jgi:hypothetical protein
MAQSVGFGMSSQLSLSVVKRTRLEQANDANDAVDGSYSAASMCQGVVVLKRTTMRGAVHGRCDSCKGVGFLCCSATLFDRH